MATALLGLTDDEARLARPDVPGRADGAAAPAGGQWVWFSDAGRAFPPLLADPREAQIRGGFSTARHGDTFGDVIFGGDIALVRRDLSADEADSLTVRGVFTTRFQMNSESTNQLNTDYVGGLAYGCRRGRTAWEVFVYHQSSHLGDETLDFNNRARIDYGKEVVRLLWSYRPKLFFVHGAVGQLRIYGGPAFAFSGEPFLRYKTDVQVGLECGLAPLGSGGWPTYLAVDVQAREVNNWRPGVNVQLGTFPAGNEEGTHPVRFFAEVYTGYSLMGQFFNVYETAFMIGMGLNW